MVESMIAEPTVDLRALAYLTTLQSQGSTGSNWSAVDATDRYDASTATTIGYSAEGRPLYVFYRGEPTAPLRILLLAGQHGDEPLAMEAVAHLAAADNLSSLVSADCSLAFVPCLNPDGVVAATRKNARGIDLNRDHQLLVATETEALHRFVRAWRPHLIVDVHTYPPRRRHLLRHNLVYCHDLFLDIPSHPAIPHPLYATASERFLQPMIEQLNQSGYQSARYTLVRPSGQVRHSTADLVDARNGLALRYGAFTVLLEGRQTRANRPTRAHVRNAQVTALQQIIGWAQQNSELLCTAAPLPQPNRAIAVRLRTVYADRQYTMLFINKQTKATQLVTLPGRYAAGVKPTRPLSLPVAYAVPRNQEGLLAILLRHGFDRQQPRAQELYPVQEYQVEQVTRKRPRLRVERSRRLLDDYFLFPVAQEGGHALALFLEPAAKYGLVRFASAGLSLQAGSAYPVLRVIDKEGFVS